MKEKINYKSRYNKQCEKEEKRYEIQNKQQDLEYRRKATK